MNHTPLPLAAALILTLTACHPARQTLRETDTRHTETADTLTRQATTGLSGHKAGTESLRETIRDTTKERTWHARDTTFVLRVKTITRERNILAHDTITLLRRDTLREASRSMTKAERQLLQALTRENRPTILERARTLVSLILPTAILLGIIYALAAIYARFRGTR